MKTVNRLHSKGFIINHIYFYLNNPIELELSIYDMLYEKESIYEQLIAELFIIPNCDYEVTPQDIRDKTIWERF